MDTSDIIDRLGGTKVVADALRLTPGIVSGWRKRGIPPNWWRIIVAHAETSGVPGVTYDAVQGARKISRERAS